MTSTPSRTASLTAAMLSELKQPSAMPGSPVQQTLYGSDLRARRHAAGDAVVDRDAVDLDVGDLPAGRRRRGVRPVAVTVAWREVVRLVDDLLAEAREVVASADQLVVAGRDRELLAGDALAVPVGWHRDAGAATERGALRPDAGVDDADNEAGAGDAEPRPAAPRGRRRRSARGTRGSSSSLAAKADPARAPRCRRCGQASSPGRRSGWPRRRCW